MRGSAGRVLCSTSRRPWRLAMLAAGVVAVLSAYAPAARAATVALTLTPARAAITAGQTDELTAQIDVPGAVLSVSRSTDAGATFVFVRTVTANAAGSATWPVTLLRTNLFRVEFAGDPVWDAAAAETTVSVKPRLTLAATSPLYQGGKVTFAARVSPAHPGASVKLQRRVDGVWTSVRTLRLDDESRVTWRWTSDVRGLLSFRVAMAADAQHLRGVSAVRYVRVKDPNPYGVPVRPAHFIVVDLSQFRLYYHEHGRIVRVFDCVLGKPSTPTPLGRFTVYSKDTDVGGAYGPRRMRYLGAFAIHGTNEPWLLARFPRAFSHGCTRLANTNILWLFERVPVGTNVWNVP
jgi:hypothetical protein